MSLAEAAVDARGTPLAALFPETLVLRLAEEYSVDAHEVRDRAQAALAAFATAPVQAFVPILVEKRLRAVYRGGLVAS